MTMKRVTRPSSTELCHICSRRELFGDNRLIEAMAGVEHRLHHPAPVDVVLRFDQPWEGVDCSYVTVFQDTDRYRMYYAYYPAKVFSGRDQYTAYAESTDGIQWMRPLLGIVYFKGSCASNILLEGEVSP